MVNNELASNGVHNHMANHYFSGYRRYYRWCRSGVAYLLSLVMLSGCATSALNDYREANPDVEFFQAIMNVAIPDVKAAQALAHDRSDAIGYACWESVDRWLSFMPPKAKPVNTGAALAIERLRVAFDDEGMIPDSVRIGCAAMYNDMKRKGLKFAAAIGAASQGVPPTMLLK